MVVKRALSALSKIGIIIAIAVAFIFGLGGTIYLSLRSPEVKVPDVKGKDRTTAETALDDAGLHMRVRATRFSPDARPDTIIDQSPQKDQIIKVGQTVAVVLARGAKEGESATPATSDNKNNNNTEKKPETDNATPNQNTRDVWETSSQNENQNKPKANKNANNRNANNSNNANNANNNNRNANNRNASNGNANNRNVNTSRPDANPGAGNVNANKRPTPMPTTPPFVPSRPPGTTP